MSTTAVSCKTSSMKSSAPMKSGAVSEAAVSEDSAVSRPRTMVEHDATAAVPAEPPMSPAPTKPTKEANAKAEAKGDSGNSDVKSGISIPPRPHSNWRAIDDPWIVFRHVHNVRLGRFDDDLLILRAHLFVLAAFQVPSLLRTITHDLNRVHYFLLLVDISIAEGRRPFQIFVHIGEHRRELRKSLHAGIPMLF